MNKLAKVIAFYLPQFHPIPENDKWWGRGFTEWTNTAKAKSLFRGHYQPHVPADLGFYDLRVPETRAAQAELAREYGIEGFCYYHYWFAGRRILERPFNEVLESGEPDFPFCLCWANHTWSGIWDGCPDRVLVEQTYPGLADYEAHFQTLLKAFTDHRYLTVDNKPIFMIYRPEDVPEIKRAMDFWRELALKAGLPGLYLIGVSHHASWTPQEFGLDAAMTQKLPPVAGRIPWRFPLAKLRSIFRHGNERLSVYSYEEMIDFFLRKEEPNYRDFPCVLPNWDNTPRSGYNGLVIHGSTPELFRRHLKNALNRVNSFPADQQIIFLKAWNEWAEGNHVEPDLRFGRGYLEVIKQEIVR